MTARRAFSLLEMILAMSIFAGALVVLGELARLGMLNAETAAQTARAQLLCESKLAELTAVPELIAPVQRAPFELQFELDEPEWLYSVETIRLSDDGLTVVRVTVMQDLPSRRRPVEVSLVRWIMAGGMSGVEVEGEEGI
jgi:general secretion pathway protein I